MEAEVPREIRYFYFCVSNSSQPGSIFVADKHLSVSVMMVQGPTTINLDVLCVTIWLVKVAPMLRMLIFWLSKPCW